MPIYDLSPGFLSFNGGLEAFVLIEDWDLATSRSETLDVLVRGNAG